MDLSFLLKFTILSLFLNGFLWGAVGATEHTETPESSTGVLYLGKFQIFPKNQYGNSLYLDHSLLTSFANRMILDVQEFPNSESLVYLYQDEEQQLAIGLYDFSESKQARIKRIDDEFYEVWVARLGTRAIFRIYEGSIQRIASHLRSARGITPALNHVAFYHIYNSEIIEEETNSYRIYDFRIHILKRGQAKPLRLQVSIRDKQSTLDLSWFENRILRYKLSDGTTGELNLPELIPNYF